MKLRTVCVKVRSFFGSLWVLWMVSCRIKVWIEFWLCLGLLLLSMEHKKCGKWLRVNGSKHTALPTYSRVSAFVSGRMRDLTIIPVGAEKRTGFKPDVWLHVSSSQQNSVAVFRELCGVSAVANLMQCVLALSSRVSGPEGNPLLLFDLRDNYPTLEPQGPLPDVLRRVVSTYETVRKESTGKCAILLINQWKDGY